MDRSGAEGCLAAVGRPAMAGLACAVAWAGRARRFVNGLPSSRKLLLLLLLALVVRCAALGQPYRDHDTVRYLQTAAVLDTAWSAGSLLPPAGSAVVRNTLDYWPPLMPFLMALLGRLGLTHHQAGVTISLGAGTLLLLPVFLMACRLWNERAGFAAAIFVALYAPLIRFSLIPRPDMLYVLLLLWAVALSWSAWREGSLTRYGGAGLLWASAYLTRPEAVGAMVLTVGALVALALRARPWGARRFAGLLLLVGVSTVLALPYLAYLARIQQGWSIVPRTRTFYYELYEREVSNLAAGKVDVGRGQEFAVTYGDPGGLTERFYEKLRSAGAWRPVGSGSAVNVRRLMKRLPLLLRFLVEQCGPLLLLVLVTILLFSRALLRPGTLLVSLPLLMLGSGLLVMDSESRYVLFAIPFLAIIGSGGLARLLVGGKEREELPQRGSAESRPVPWPRSRLLAVGLAALGVFSLWSIVGVTDPDTHLPLECARVPVYAHRWELIAKLTAFSSIGLVVGIGLLLGSARGWVIGLAGGASFLTVSAVLLGFEPWVVGLMRFNSADAPWETPYSRVGLLLLLSLASAVFCGRAWHLASSIGPKSRWIRSFTLLCLSWLAVANLQHLAVNLYRDRGVSKVAYLDGAARWLRSHARPGQRLMAPSPWEAYLSGTAFVRPPLNSIWRGPDYSSYVRRNRVDWIMLDLRMIRDHATVKRWLDHAVATGWFRLAYDRTRRPCLNARPEWVRIYRVKTTRTGTLPGSAAPAAACAPWRFAGPAGRRSTVGASRRSCS